MHPYTTDSKERKTIPVILIIPSLFCAALFNWMISPIVPYIPWFFQPLYFGAPSAIAFYYILLNIFDESVWRWSIFHKTKMVKIPDLNGSWSGYIVSSFDEHKQNHDMNLKISQSWYNIQIDLESAHSKSHSYIAGLLLNDEKGITLYYQFRNYPKSHAVETMHTHIGTAWLVFNKEKNSLEGEYYTGRDRNNFGKMVFTGDN